LEGSQGVCSGALSFSGSSNLPRIGVYVDGFNLYYGELEQSPYRWLDTHQLAVNLLSEKDNIVVFKYFTAPVDGSDSSVQSLYLKALKAHRPNVEIINGQFQRRQAWLKPIAGGKRVGVWKREEKGTDVNLAVHMLDDAWRNAYDGVAVVSNDSDLLTAIRMVKAQGKFVILVPPLGKHRKKIGNSRMVRYASSELKAEANVIKTIFAKHLANAQLPSPIPAAPKLHRPPNW
ncbi:MAG: NYN domain-containing protein, partial [Chloroflexota bacterium]